MDTLNDHDLVARIHNHDTAAESELVKLFYSKVKMIVNMRINDREDQKELINDILIAAVLKIRNGNFDLERDSSLSKYINGITRNSINQYLKDHYKKHDRNEKIKVELLADTLNTKIEKYELEKTEEIEQNKKIWRNLIKQLKPKYREVVNLKYYDNLSVSEISEKLNVSTQKVSDYLKYSKQLLMQNFPNKK
jgi:RNA polymerase sigma factor (sigma-70 family)